MKVDPSVDAPLVIRKLVQAKLKYPVIAVSKMIKNALFIVLIRFSEF